MCLFFGGRELLNKRTVGQSLFVAAGVTRVNSDVNCNCSHNSVCVCACIYKECDRNELQIMCVCVHQRQRVQLTDAVINVQTICCLPHN